MVADSSLATVYELDSFVTKFRYLCSAGFNASLTVKSNGDGRARVSFEVDLGFLQPPLTVPPPVSPVPQRRSPAYFRRLKKRKDCRQKIGPLFDSGTTNESIVVTEEVIEPKHETTQIDTLVVKCVDNENVVEENAEEVFESTDEVAVNDLGAEEAVRILKPIETAEIGASNGFNVEKESHGNAGNTLDAVHKRGDDNGEDLLPFDHNLSAIENLQNLTLSLNQIATRRNNHTVF